MADSGFDDTVAFLTKADAKGQSLQDHLTKVLLTVGKERLNGSLEKFEDISAQLKGKMVVPIYKDLTALDNNQKCREQLLKASDAMSQLALSGESKDEDDQQEEDGESTMPDILTQARMFEWAGINLGSEETYALFCSIDRHIKDQQSGEDGGALNYCRFFGKIFGLNADYFILEAKFTEAPEVDLEEGSRMEAPGAPGGVNEYVYFATTNLTGAWTQLPWLKPEMITIARPMKRYFTGDLNAPVRGFPRFPYTEAHYLRAQIARICSATVVCPSGVYEEPAPEDEPAPLAKAENFVAPPTEAMALYEKWVHCRNFMFEDGRQTPFVSDEDPDPEDDKDDASQQAEDKEEAPPALRPIDEDKSNFGQKIWSLRPCGPLHSAHTVIALHNLHWPGAVSVYKNGAYASIYMGFGHKYSSLPYAPPPPPAMQPEFVSQPPAGPLIEQNDPPQSKKDPSKDENQKEDREEDDEED